MNLDQWLQEIEALEDREFFGPVAGERVEAASRDVGLRFPPQYREFLSTIGAGSVGSESSIGLGGPQDLDVVWMYKALRNKMRARPFPASLIPLRSDGF